MDCELMKLTQFAGANDVNDKSMRFIGRHVCVPESINAMRSLDIL